MEYAKSNGGVYFICFKLKKVNSSANSVQKIAVASLSKKFEYEEFNSDVHFFLFSTESILLFGNLFQKSKSFVEAKTLLIN